MELPPIGLGTWELRGKACVYAVTLALELGYRHIDTAHVYENHQAIGNAIKGFDRKKLFITSKIALEQVNEKDIQGSVDRACNLALKELQVEYLDLYLLHWPDHAKPLAKMVKAMEKMIADKRVVRIGVSNFTIHHLEDLLEQGIKPAVNQVEFHPYLYQKKLLDYCNAHNIEVIAYRPLGKGRLLQDEVLQQIGKIHRKTTAQIILRWLYQKKIPTIPKAASKVHLMENLSIFDFSLSVAETAQIDALHRNLRLCGADDEEFAY